MGSSSGCVEIVRNNDSAGDWYYVLDAKSHPHGYGKAPEGSESQFANPLYAIGCVGPAAIYNEVEYTARVDRVAATLNPLELFDDQKLARETFTQSELVALGAYAITGRLNDLQDGEIVTAYGNMRDMSLQEIEEVLAEDWTFTHNQQNYKLAA